MEQLYTLPEAAKVLRQSDVTIRRWLKSGKLKGTKPGRKWLITASAVEACSESNSDKQETQ